MSRSCKKNPAVTDDSAFKKKAKVAARRTVRRKLQKDDYCIANGNAYKKETESWKIVGDTYRYSKEQATALYKSSEYLREEFPTLEEWLAYWKKYAVRK